MVAGNLLGGSGSMDAWGALSDSGMQGVSETCEGGYPA